MADLLEDDTMVLPNAEPIKFKPPDPEPMDFNAIDLKPFEDPSSPWTEEYSNLLKLKHHPRSYQIEIIRDAIRNGNTIVCLQTGSGKTFIAALLIKYYYIKRQQTNPGTKFFTLFFVPRKAIRLQQATAISNIGNLRVQICQDDQTIDKLISTNDVIVATPQKFVNCLKNEKLHLSQIDLMIFDECHNTSGANPYSEIMKFYLCPSRKQSTDVKPFIIGLTATVSAKDAVEKKDTIINNLGSLCGKLACKTISTVCDPNNIEEMHREISRPKNDQFEFVKKVQYDSYFDEYLKLFQNLITKIKEHLDSHELLDGHEMGSSGFIGELVLLKQDFERKGATDNIIICHYLLLLTKKYAALKNLPFDMVIKYIAQAIDKYHERFDKPASMDNLLHERCKAELDAILEKHQEHPTRNPKLDILDDVLKLNAQEGKKGLILVQTTFYAKTLYDYLYNHPYLTNIVRPTWLVGQRSADYCMTIHEQETALRQFREGECNVLVATDIVQEGLDIPTCSYVIRYEFVSDEIGTIQSRGRARAQNSAYYLITESESVNHRREQNNKIREDNMEIIIAEWPSFDKDAFHREVETKAKSIIADWEKLIKDELKQKEKLQELGKKTGSICCRKCNRELGKLEWLRRRRTIYFINHQEFFNDKKYKLKKLYESFQENLAMGEVKCTCGASLGGYQKYTDRPELGTLCALKCEQIKFKIEDQTVFTQFKKWSENDRFDIEELEEI